MIRFCDEKGLIVSKGIHTIGGHKDPSFVLPKVAIGVFSFKLFEDIVEKFSSLEVGFIKCANYSSKVYIIKYKDEEFTLFLAGVSAPHIVSNIEDLKINGVKKFIIFGNCGVLDKNIEDCSIIIPNIGYREEGTSYHYAPESETIEINPKYQKEFIDIVKRHGFDYKVGGTWTTDGFFRETRSKMNYFKEKGCISVEMEGTAIAAACKYLNLDYFTFYYAGDNLDGAEWEERSLSELVNFDKKKQVLFLALDLALILNKER